ncbi:Uncharacterized protein YydD, contains DUF2326 domain [Kaistella treverensis]|uniref:Uncharacterized protein YydD, contains DUF2326 domain n=1 Tax=Kaistella treverensis TaxID=631455 RepID=A0A1I3N3C5_9FLAO|nr:DUF2326 domain-containing protein [Kaistella treverensis]SFJ03530.1 Uncharacterized protein YydD, contains DUF2326 domain [Kaistella treverensis]
MFLKRLIIENKAGVIRDIPFKKGINLIVDETPETLTQQTTGNNVGKTTVLRLVDYCLGSKGESIYKDTEFSQQPNTTIENFLTDTEVLVTIELVEDLDDENSEHITIQRNFLKRGKKVQKINGEDFTDDKKFDAELKRLVFNTDVEKPTFRQIISKNIRIDKDRMDKIVRVLGSFVGNEVYEALYLFWLGIKTDKAEEKRNLTEDRKSENRFRRRLKKEGELSLIEQKLAFHNDKIKELDEQKANFNLNEQYDEDIEKLNQVKYALNRTATEISQLEVRRDLIIESKDDLEQEYANINTSQIRSLYDKANALIPDIQVTFEETLKFHNELISEKLDYITKELPDLDIKLKKLRADLAKLRDQEFNLTTKIQKSGVIEDLEKIVTELNKQFERKGNLEEQKRLWEVSNEKMDRIERELGLINEDITSNDDLITSRVTQFNKYFTKMSEILYDENYILTPRKKDVGYDLIVTNIEGNPSTGKKKGQIAAFDFAYIQFADNLDIRCLHFILHDQLENIHDNQLNTLVEVANSLNGQYIVPILRDKIPSNIDISQYEVLSLSQSDKLFRL